MDEADRLPRSALGRAGLPQIHRLADPTRTPREAAAVVRPRAARSSIPTRRQPFIRGSGSNGTESGAELFALANSTVRVVRDPALS